MRSGSSRLVQIPTRRHGHEPRRPAGRSGGRPRASTCAGPGERRDPVPWPDGVQGLLEHDLTARRSPTTAGTGPATSVAFGGAERLVLYKSIKDIIVLPDGFVYPEDLENALDHQLKAMIIKTPPAGSRRSSSCLRTTSALRTRYERDQRARTQLRPDRIGGCALSPGEDSRPDHTLKVKRDPVRRWAAAEAHRCRSVGGSIGRG